MCQYDVGSCLCGITAMVGCLTGMGFHVSREKGGSFRKNKVLRCSILFFWDLYDKSVKGSDPVELV